MGRLIQGQLKNKKSAYTLEDLINFLVDYDLGEKDSWSTYRNARHFYRYSPLKGWCVFTPEFARKERPDLPDIREFNIPSGMIDVVSRQSPGVLEDVDTVSKVRGRPPQIAAILKAAINLGFNPMDIPVAGKAAIKTQCLKDVKLFTEDGFLHAWKEANKQNVISIQDKEKYLPTR